MTEEPAGAEIGSPGPHWRQRWLIAGIALIVVAVVVTVTLATSSGEKDPRTQPGGPWYTCIEVSPPHPDEGYCDRATAEFARRHQPEAADMGRAEQKSSAIMGIAARAGWCPKPNHQSCIQNVENHPPTPEDVVAAQAALSGLGTDEVVVRLARLDDPAPVGAILYSVRFGTACVVGYWEKVPLGVGGQIVVGLRPDNRCLAQ